MSKKLVGYIIFFAVLIVVFLFSVFAGTDNWKSKTPSISYVKPFNFTHQDGALFSENNMQGKVCVINYFFTTCKGICPRMNNNMRKIYNEFKDVENFMIVSHTSDPATDSAAKLKRYSDSLKVDTDKWVFLTGRKDSLYQTARNSYLLDDPKNNVKDVNDDFMHTQFIALVDKNGKVRGQIYDGLKASDLAKLKDNIQDLLKEKAGESGFANSIFTNNPQ
jgi:protein SCO1/2